MKCEWGINIFPVACIIQESILTCQDMIRIHTADPGPLVRVDSRTWTAGFCVIRISMLIHIIVVLHLASYAPISHYLPSFQFIRSRFSSHRLYIRPMSGCVRPILLNEPEYRLPTHSLFSAGADSMEYPFLCRLYHSSARLYISV